MQFSLEMVLAVMTVYMDPGVFAGCLLQKLSVCHYEAAERADSYQRVEAN